MVTETRLTTVEDVDNQLTAFRRRISNSYGPVSDDSIEVAWSIIDSLLDRRNKLTREA